MNTYRFTLKADFGKFASYVEADNLVVALESIKVRFGSYCIVSIALQVDNHFIEL